MCMYLSQQAGRTSVQAKVAIVENSKAARAWRMLRLNTSVRKSSRIMASMLPANRGSIGRVNRLSGGESDELLAPDEQEAMDEEAADALQHLASIDSGGPIRSQRSDGYRVSAHLAAVLVVSRIVREHSFSRITGVCD